MEPQSQILPGLNPIFAQPSLKKKGRCCCRTYIRPRPQIGMSGMESVTKDGKPIKIPLKKTHLDVEIINSIASIELT